MVIRFFVMDISWIRKYFHDRISLIFICRAKPTVYLVVNILYVLVVVVVLFTIVV